MGWKEYDVPEEPKLSLRDEISPMQDPVPVGRLAIPYNREYAMVFAKKVKRGDPPEDPIHYYNKYEGYAMSKDIIDQLKIDEVELVFTYKEDTDMVFEHRLEDFEKLVDNGSYMDDEQYCASENDAEYKWEDLGEDLFTNESFWSQQ